MRLITGIIFMALLSIGNSVMAVGPVDEQQLMLYYEIPFGGSDAKDSHHQFGLRLDRTTHAPGDPVEINSFMKQQAMLDFRMNHDGIQSFDIHGVDYLGKLKVVRAAAEEETMSAEDPATGEPVPAEGSGGEQAVDEGTAETDAEPAKAEVEKTGFEKGLDELPIGYFLGAMILLVIVAGAGG